MIRCHTQQLYQGPSALKLRRPTNAKVDNNTQLHTRPPPASQGIQDGLPLDLEHLLCPGSA